MKNFLMCMVSMMLLAGSATAQQKIGHVSTDAIMKQLPDAQDAQKQLDALVVEWQGELNKMQQDWQKKFDDYNQKKLIMTDARRAEAERDLRDLDQRIADYRSQKFGQSGELFQKQNDLMKPVQDRVFKAIQDVATEEGYDYVLDKSGEILMMYANEKHDLTTKVLQKLNATLAPTSPKAN
ncbi:MAG TPA: OmpH family outer membrane protein [Bacteroidota bacterium]|nr:OmpH family outer membrane protein [Bacteroidota bacterium]